MKIAFVGKGGSGKTTLSALFARHLASTGAQVVAVDADINQHLGVALGLSEREAAAVPALGAHLPRAKEYLRGDNPRIADAADMVKTTPAGRGSRLLRVAGGDDPFHTDWSIPVAPNLRLMASGPFAEDDLGVACYHSKTGAVELYLNHLVDVENEYVVVDMTAGADCFASGLFTRFDLTFLVAEPTVRGTGVYQQYRDYADGYDVALAVVGNKVTGPEDADFLRDRVGADLLACFGSSRYVRAAEQGRVEPLDLLEPEYREVLRILARAAQARPKGPEAWARFQRQAVEFHLRNARAWAGRATGADLAAHVDPEFVHGPQALSAVFA